MSSTYFTLQDRKHGLFLVAGDNYDSQVYHGEHRDRQNSQWRFDPAGGDFYYIFDRKHGKCLVAGDHYDGRVYHQDPKNRPNAKWKVVPGSVPGTFTFIDQKHGKALVTGDSHDSRVYHQDPQDRPNAIWGLKVAYAGDQKPHFYTQDVRGTGKQIKILSVKCIKPSSAIDDVARGIFGAIGGVLGAVAGAAGTAATGGALAATIGLGAAGGVGTGVGVIEGLDHKFAGEDQLYIKVNGKKVWPDGKYSNIDSQESQDVNYTMALEFNVNIELWEWDAVSDDHLGTLTILPEHQTGDFTYVVPNEEEGSLYDVMIRVTG